MSPSYRVRFSFSLGTFAANRRRCADLCGSVVRLFRKGRFVRKLQRVELKGNKWLGDLDFEPRLAESESLPHC